MFTLNFLRLLYPPLRSNAEFNGDKHTNTTDATRISYVYVRTTIPGSLEHKIHTHPSTGACPVRTPRWLRSILILNTIPLPTVERLLSGLVPRHAGVVPFSLSSAHRRGLLTSNPKTWPRRHFFWFGQRPDRQFYTCMRYVYTSSPTPKYTRNNDHARMIYSE